jgi:YD repeat-containing protein
MVGIFTGLGAGFERGSGASLGGLGMLGSSGMGRSGEGVSVNALTGNLVVSRQDEYLVGRGPDAAVNRTYNSLGALDENGDHWRLGSDRRVFGLVGSVNSWGSTVRRVSADGSEITYSFDGSGYVATDGAGAHDRLSFNGSVWTWSDGDTGVKENYEAWGGYWRIASMVDRDGNALSYSYSGSNLYRVTTANGEYVEYGWSGSNLTQVTTGYTDLYYGGARVLTRVRYAYDGANRLSQVTVDLSPEDNAIGDGKVYVTNYAYHGSSRLISAIWQTDGSRLDIGYDGASRVTSLVQTVASGVTRTTSLSYLSGQTDITDPRGSVTSLFTNGAGQLWKITAPPAQAGQAAQSVLFEYDGSGNVTKVTDAGGGITQYQYDGRGNTTRVIDATGNITDRVYDGNNNLLVETRTGSSGAGPSTTLSTRYVYDSEGHLSYTISAEGRVTRMVYNADGTVVATAQFHTALYPAGSNVLDENTMHSWWNGQGGFTGTTAQYHYYDARGNGTVTVNYGETTSGSWTSDGYSQHDTVYDQSGQIRFRKTTGENWEYFYHDGLGRLIGTTDKAGAQSTVVFNDAASQTVVTTASGYVTTQTYNRAGELIAETGAGAYTSAGTSNLVYDRNGQLRSMTDASGRTSYFVYDRVGRKVADVSQDGHVVEYRYDGAGRLSATARYSNGAASMAGITDPNAEVDINALRPAAYSQDIWEWHVYDAAGRVVQTILGDGSTTRFAYDGAGRLVSTFGYYNKLTAGQVAAFMVASPTVVTLPAGDSRDSVTRSFYDRDGLLTGVLNGEGGLSRIVYDGKGRKVAETAYAGVTAAHLRASGSYDQLLASISASPARDVTLRYVYDGQDQLRFTIDGLGRVTENIYFQGAQWAAYAGVRRTVAYAVPIGVLGSYTVDTVKAAVAGQVGSSANRSTWLAYDTKGQLGYSVDAAGAVTGYSYDIAGRVIATTQYATTVDMNGMGDAADWKANLDGWAAGNGAGARVTRTFYAARGEARFTMDAQGYVTQFDYDAAGRVVAQRRYETALAVHGGWTIASVDAAAKGNAAVTSYGYDGKGRLVDTWDANGTRRHTGYHANGLQAWNRIAHGQAGEAWDYYVHDQAGRVTHVYDTDWNWRQARSYDGLGNVAVEYDQSGTATSFTYDRAGRVLTSTNALGGVTAYEYDGAGRGVKVTDARGNASWQYYDASGRVTLSVDGEGYATSTTYNAFGEVASVRRHGAKASGVGSVANPPSVINGAGDAVTSFTYDSLGRVTRTTDGLGQYEEVTYNSFGQVVTSRNKLGGITSYAYDSRGLLISQTNPVGIVTQYEYDSRGNRTKLIEAAGLAEQRITTFQYDAGDRLTHKISQARLAVASGTAGEAWVTPTEQYFYDRRGNLIEKRGPDGARQLFWYDRLNRVTHSLSAGGTLSQNIYDLDGNVIEARVYETLMGLPGDATGAPPAGSGSYRVTQYSYDALNRVSEQRVPGVVTAVFNGSLSVTTRTVTTSYAYDAMGNVVRTTDGEGRMVHSYYDGLGRKTSEVDQENYRTDWVHDANGNVTGETRYASQTGAASVGSAPPAVGGSAGDRITTFAYDVLGRRTSLSRHNVQVHNGAGAQTTVTSTVSYQYNGLNQVTRKTEATGEQVNNQYDLAGRLWRQEKTAINGAASFNGASVTPTIDYSYDGLGNLKTTTQYGFGQADTRVSTFTYGTGGLLVSATDASGFTRTYRHDAAGRVTREEYMRAGLYGTVTHEASGTDYDIEGRVVAQGIVMNQGGWTRGNGVSNDTVAMQYNAFGEVTARGINGVFAEQTAYDNAGRAWRTNSGDGVWKYMLYNGTGQQTVAITSEGSNLAGMSLDGVMNLWGASRAAIGTDYVDGVTATITRYDARGQAIEVREPQRELNATTRQTLLTRRGYNAFGEVAWERNAGGFDAAGNDTGSDAQGNIATRLISYSYNTMGRQIRIESPEVAVTDAAGNTASQRPTEHRYYDVSGRLVASRDANGNLTRLTLLGGTGYEGSQAQVTRVDNADGSYSQNRFDVFGDLRTAIGSMSAGGPAGYQTDISYDRMGRKIQVTHAGGLVESFSYDGLGQQLKRWTNAYSPDDQDNSYWNEWLEDWVYSFAPGVREEWVYDQQGRVTSQRGMGGDVTTFAHSWNGGLTTAGMGTFGGWTKTTTFANAMTTSESTDMFGRTTSTTDMGGRVSASSYDLAGRMTARTGGATLNMSWLNTGRLASQETTRTVSSGLYNTETRTTTTSYGYDAPGNLTAEQTVNSGTRDVYEWDPEFYYYVWNGTESFSNVVSSQTASYDGLGRLTSWNETGGNAGVLSPATSTWNYDANGNIRRNTASFRSLDTNGGISGSATTHDHWFTFDAMNRVTIDKGTLVGGQIVRGETGTSIIYNGRGERAHTLRDFSTYQWMVDPNYYDPYYEDPAYYDPYYGYWGPYGGYPGGYMGYVSASRREDYSYNAAGQITQVSYAEGTPGAPVPTGPGGRIAEMVYDISGRLIRQTDYTSPGGWQVAVDRQVSYDAGGRVITDTTRTRQNDNVFATATSTFNYGGNAALGSPLSVSTTNTRHNNASWYVGSLDQWIGNAASTTWSTTSYSYAWYQGAVQTGITLQEGNATRTTSFTLSTVAGNAITTSVYIGDGRARTVNFTTDLSGQVIKRAGQERR